MVLPFLNMVIMGMTDLAQENWTIGNAGGNCHQKVKWLTVCFSGGVGEIYLKLVYNSLEY